MINEDRLVAVAHITKTHGVNGEMVVVIDRDFPQWDELRCIFMKMDGLPVPFFVETARPKSNESDLITLDGITTEKQASELCGKTIYIERDDLPDNNIDSEDGFYADDLIGFDAYTDSGESLGKITNIDTATTNTLFIITAPDSEKEILIPAAADFIADVNPQELTVAFSLPPGLID